MWKKFSYVPVEEAHRILMKAVRVEVRREMVPIHEAYDRVLAEDVISDVDVPSFSVSHYDGYAVRAEDTMHASINNPILLRVTGKIHLRDEWRYKIGFKEAAYITTGSPLPLGADAVIPVEMAKNKGEFIEIRHDIKPYENVVPVGRDLKKGETVFKTGHILRAQDIKFLADLKKWEIAAFRKPIIAIISVGNELTDRIEEADTKKFDSHSLMVSTLVNAVGGVPLKMGVVPDDIDAIKKSLRRGLKGADIIATIGGCSVGEEDYVWEAVNSLGKPGGMIRGIKAQPGRVTSLGIANDKPIVMLPGHVQSTLVGFYMLLLPLIRLMSGVPSTISHPTLRAKMSQRILLKEFAPFQRIRFVNVLRGTDGYVAEPILGDSALISVLVRANGFVIIPKRKTLIEKGEKVDVCSLPGVYKM